MESSISSLVTPGRGKTYASGHILISAAMCLILIQAVFVSSCSGPAVLAHIHTLAPGGATAPTHPGHETGGALRSPEGPQHSPAAQTERHTPGCAATERTPTTAMSGLATCIASHDLTIQSPANGQMVSWGHVDTVSPPDAFCTPPEPPPRLS